MVRRALCALPILLAGCAAAPRLPVRSGASPPARRAQPVGLAERVRQEGWLTRFWAQLTPVQRRRVLARLRQGEPPLAETEAEAARVWDPLGLPARDALVFGAGAAALQQRAAHSAL